MILSKHRYYPITSRVSCFTCLCGLLLKPSWWEEITVFFFSWEESSNKNDLWGPVLAVTFSNKFTPPKSPKLADSNMPEFTYNFAAEGSDFCDNLSCESFSSSKRIQAYFSGLEMGIYHNRWFWHHLEDLVLACHLGQFLCSSITTHKHE